MSGFIPGEKVRGGRIIALAGDRVIVASPQGVRELCVSTVEPTMIEEGAERSGQLPPEGDFPCNLRAA